MESIEQLLISNINQKADEMTNLINALNKNSEVSLLLRAVRCENCS